MPAPSPYQTAHRRHVLQATVRWGSALVGAGPLTACQVATGSQAPPATPVVAPAGTTATTDVGAVSLAVAYPYFGADKTIFPAIFDAFDRSGPGRRIENAYGAAGFQQYAEKVAAAVVAGTGPDVIVSHPNWFASWVGKGFLLDLAPYTRRDRSVNLDDFYPSAVQNVQLNGKLYGIPYYFGPAVFYFNKSLVEKVGAADPDAQEKTGKWDWPAFVAAARQATTGDGAAKTFGYDSLSANLSDVATWVWSNGGEPWNDTLTESRLDQPAAVAALEFQADLLRKYQVVPTPDDQVQQGFQNGRVAMINSGRWNVPNLKLLTSLQLGTAPVPKGPAGRHVTAGGQGWCILQPSRRKDLAWEFLKFAVSDAGQAPLLAAGRSQPVSRSLASAPAYLQSLQPWESAAVYADAAVHGRTFRAPVQVQEIQQAFSAAWNSVLAGQQSMLAAMAAFVRQANALLQAP